MSDFSLTLVSHLKTSKIINDMAKVSKKSEKITAMAANFYRYIVALPLMAVLFGIKATDRVKSFLFRFIAVPAKWVRTARQYRLNIYSNKPYKLIWEHG